MKKTFIISLCCAAFTLGAGAQRIAVLSDLHVIPGNENDRQLRLAVEEINHGEFDYVVVNGDISNEGSDEQLLNVKEILDGISKPLAVLPGNHENNWSQSATKTFKDTWGNDRFIATAGPDSLVIVGINCGPYMKMGDGHIKREDLHWLRAELQKAADKGRRVLSFNHYPLQENDLDNWREYVQLLQQYPVIGHINGHYHSWQAYRAGGIPAVMTRALPDRVLVADVGVFMCCGESQHRHRVVAYALVVDVHPVGRHFYYGVAECAVAHVESPCHHRRNTPGPVGLP